MASRNKSCLIAGRRKVYAVVEQDMKKLIESLGVACHHLIVASDAFLLGEKHPKHAACMVSQEGDAGGISQFL